MSGIVVTEKEQIGGFKSILFITLDEIINCPELLTNLNAFEFTSSPPLNAVNVRHVGETMRVTARPSRTKAGLLYSINCQLNIEEQSIEIDNYLFEKQIKPGVLITEKHFGQKMLFGSKNFPLRMTYEGIHGDRAEDGNLIVVKISGKIPQKPIILTNS